MEESIEVVGTEVLPLIRSLDFRFILIMILLNTFLQSIESDIKLEWFSTISKRVKVAVTGLLLAPLYYWLFDLEKASIGILFMSYLVTFTFHKLIAEFFIERIKRLFPYQVKISTKTKQDE